MASAVLTGLLGVIYAHSLGYTTTDSVYRDDTNLSLIVYSLLGGMGTLFGPVIGAFMLVFITQVVLAPPARLPPVRHRPVAGAAGARGARRRAGPGEELEAPPTRGRDGACRMNAAPILGVEALSKRFRGLLAISDVSFTVEPGSITSVIGPNGAGKSTLFNLVTGYLAPTAGDGPVQGAPDHRPGDQPHRRARHRAAFQIARPFRDLSVAENVRIGALFGKAGSARRRRHHAQRPGTRRHRPPCRGAGERADGRASFAISRWRAPSPPEPICCWRTALRRPQSHRDGRDDRRAAPHSRERRHGGAGRARHAVGHGSVRPHPGAGIAGRLIADGTPAEVSSNRK